VSFCNTGHWASINWFVMSELLGVNNTRLYAESIGAWSAEALPMDNRPNRGAVYRELTVQWLRSLFGVQEPL
jgi:thiosulfate/3-mercaptopyruvate sulfurtransferase